MNQECAVHEMFRCHTVGSAIIAKASDHRM
jgi:hypothetical protein